MSLRPGTRLGPYEIIAPLGAGGMGEVYQARDTRLDRTVAVKILPGHLAADPASRARFEREARAVSALSHPHICTLHDIGEQGGVHYLVMEHLEGETLASRLERGKLPPEEAVAIATQVALAMAQAHRSGVVHRDLKPGNVMLTRAGAKLLDFGLAKQGPQAAPPLSSAVMTEASPLTAQGTIVGTWQYMSPEQMEGLEADFRSDIFAFGAVLYEMLSGRRAFEGRSQASLIAAILGSQPAPLTGAVPGLSPSLERVVRRCLAKDPEDRWQSAADLASELKWISQGGVGEGMVTPSLSAATGVSGITPGSGPWSGSGAPSPGTPAPAEAAPGAGRARGIGKERLVWMILVAGLIAAVVAVGLRSFPTSTRRSDAITASLLPPFGARLDPRYAPAVSPDGKMVAAVVVGADGKSSLHLRRFDRDEMRPLPGTEDAGHPFWSPDSRWIGFFSGDKLKKIDIAGGPSIVLCNATDGRGGTWSRNGAVIFQPRYSDPLFRVPAAGGTPEPVTRLDEKQFHIAHRWPAFLPDGKRFLFYVVATTNPTDSPHSGIYLGSLDSPEIRQLLKVDSRMAFAQGQLLYKRGATLMAQPFDPESAALTGDPLPLAADVAGGTYSWGGANFSVSDQGVLVFLPGSGEGETELTWFDREGKRLGRLGDADYYFDLRLAPDGRRAIFSIGRDAGDLWLHDLERDVRSRFTFDAANDITPVFSPDGGRVAFGSSRKAMGELYVRDTRGTGSDELLHSSNMLLQVSDWSPDGRSILFNQLSRDTGFDLWTWSMETKQAEPWLEAPLDQLRARFAPNGRWVAYDSAESGRFEIYVQAFPAKGGGRWQVSRSGGTNPLWRADGKELFFSALDDSLMAAAVRTEGDFEPGTPRALFRGAFKSGLGQNFDATPDGRRFLLNSLKESDRSGQFATVLLNWPAALRR